MKICAVAAALSQKKQKINRKVLNSVGKWT